jgi:hypothetical protein
MIFFLYVTTFLHAALYGVDEYIYHRKRGLCPVEFINALFDGILFLIPLVIAIFTSHSYWLDKIYIALAVLSIFSIIKNERFYHELCVTERMIHAALYVLHPLILYAFYHSWKWNFFDKYYYFWLVQLLYVAFGTKTVTYHIIYWKFIRGTDERPKDCK